MIILKYSHSRIPDQSSLLGQLLELLFEALEEVGPFRERGENDVRLEKSNALFDRVEVLLVLLKNVGSEGEVARSDEGLEGRVEGFDLIDRELRDLHRALARHNLGVRGSKTKFF